MPICSQDAVQPCRGTRLRVSAPRHHVHTVPRGALFNSALAEDDTRRECRQVKSRRTDSLLLPSPSSLCNAGVRAGQGRLGGGGAWGWGRSGNYLCPAGDYGVRVHQVGRVNLRFRLGRREEGAARRDGPAEAVLPRGTCPRGNPFTLLARTGTLRALTPFNPLPSCRNSIAPGNFQ